MRKKKGFRCIQMSRERAVTNGRAVCEDVWEIIAVVLELRGMEPQVLKS